MVESCILLIFQSAERAAAMSTQTEKSEGEKNRLLKTALKAILCSEKSRE